MMEPSRRRAGWTRNSTAISYLPALSFSHQVAKYERWLWETQQSGSEIAGRVRRNKKLWVTLALLVSRHFRQIKTPLHQLRQIRQEIRIWYAAIDEEHESESHRGCVNAVVYSPDRKLVASSELENHAVWLWDTMPGKDKGKVGAIVNKLFPLPSRRSRTARLWQRLRVTRQHGSGMRRRVRKGCRSNATTEWSFALPSFRRDDSGITLN